MLIHLNLLILCTFYSTPSRTFSLKQHSSVLNAILTLFPLQMKECPYLGRNLLSSLQIKFILNMFHSRPSCGNQMNHFSSSHQLLSTPVSDLPIHKHVLKMVQVWSIQTYTFDSCHVFNIFYLAWKLKQQSSILP